MTSTLPRPTPVGEQYGYPGPVRRTPPGSRLTALPRTTDAKQADNERWPTGRGHDGE